MAEQVFTRFRCSTCNNPINLTLGECKCRRYTSRYDASRDMQIISERGRVVAVVDNFSRSIRNSFVDVRVL